MSTKSARLGETGGAANIRAAAGAVAAAAIGLEGRRVKNIRVHGSRDGFWSCGCDRCLKDANRISQSL